MHFQLFNKRRDFDAGLIGLLLNVLPTITASKAYNGRAAVSDALADYYAAKYDEGPEVSQMVRGRAAIFRSESSYSSKCLRLHQID